MQISLGLHRYPELSNTEFSNAELSNAELPNVRKSRASIQVDSSTSASRPYVLRFLSSISTIYDTVDRSFCGHSQVLLPAGRQRMQRSVHRRRSADSSVGLLLIEADLETDVRTLQRADQATMVGYQVDRRTVSDANRRALPQLSS